MFSKGQNGKVFKRSLLVALIMNATIAQANNDSTSVTQEANFQLTQASSSIQSVENTVKTATVAATQAQSASEESVQTTAIKAQAKAETVQAQAQDDIQAVATKASQAKQTIADNAQQTADKAAAEVTSGESAVKDTTQNVKADLTASTAPGNEQAVKQVAEKITVQAQAVSQKVEQDDKQNIVKAISPKVQMQGLLKGIKGVTNKTLLTKIYGERDFKPLWTNELAEELFMRNYITWAISNVSPQANKLLATLSELPKNSNPMLKDVLLSDAFLNYLYYQDKLSKKSEQWLYENSKYQVGQPSSSSVKEWIAAVDKNSALTYMRSIQPSNKLYRAAVDKIMTMLPKGNSKSSITFNQRIKPGNSSSQLANLAKILKANGVLAKDYQLTGNKYTGELVEGVKAFQKKNGLTADGIIGTNTLTVLNNNPTKQLYKLAINAQRLRLLPNFENGIFVNIPTYYLNFYKNGKNIFKSRVIVGRDERKTPVMRSRLSNVVINPPWNAPSGAITEDIIAKVKKDPSYIYRHGYQIISGRGKVVDPYTIDWEATTAENFPYRLRQSAGGKRGSALGHYKFNMPSKDAIFLHDTPNKGLFSRNSRALSSGCVRVQRSDDLAELLVKQVGWSEARKDEALKSRKTVSVNVKRDPVYLYYVTSWVENGKVHNVADIYDWDRSFSKTKIDWNNVRKLLN